MAACTTSVRVLNVLKQCCNPLNVIHSVRSKKNLRPVLDWTIKKVPSIQKGERLCDKCRETVANLPEYFGKEAAVSSSSGCDRKKRKS
jgi:hypothetical protein